MDLFRVEDVIKPRRIDGTLKGYIADKQVELTQRLIILDMQECELKDKKQTMTFALLRKEKNMLVEYMRFLESLLNNY